MMKDLLKNWRIYMIISLIEIEDHIVDVFFGCRWEIETNQRDIRQQKRIQKYLNKLK